MSLRAILIASLLPLAMASTALAEGDQKRLLTVNGHGEAAAAPDMAMVTFGAAFRDPKARGAVARVAEKMNAVMAALSELGVEPRDLQTSTLTLNPVYHHSNNAPPRLDGYEARNAVTARLRDVAKLGAAIDVASAAGATEFGGVSFGFADPDPLSDAALQAAVKDAARKARLVAEASGATLGPIHSINIGGYGAPQPAAMKEMAMMRADSGAMPVASGESRIEADVSVTYELK